jgi:hypothetical protein
VWVDHRSFVDALELSDPLLGRRLRLGAAERARRGAGTRAPGEQVVERDLVGAIVLGQQGQQLAAVLLRVESAVENGRAHARGEQVGVHAPRKVLQEKCSCFSAIAARSRSMSIALCFVPTKGTEPLSRIMRRRSAQRHPANRRGAIPGRLLAGNSRQEPDHLGSYHRMRLVRARPAGIEPATIGLEDVPTPPTGTSTCACGCGRGFCSCCRRRG